MTNPTETNFMYQTDAANLLTKILDNVPFYNGKNIPLEQYLKDLECAMKVVPPQLEDLFLRFLQLKFYGDLRDYILENPVNKTKELLRFLKSKYDIILESEILLIRKLEQISQKDNETVSDFSLRISAIAAKKKDIMNDQTLTPTEADRKIDQLRKKTYQAISRGLRWEIRKEILNPPDK